MSTTEEMPRARPELLTLVVRGETKKPLVKEGGTEVPGPGHYQILVWNLILRNINSQRQKSMGRLFTQSKAKEKDLKPLNSRSKS